MTHSYYVNYTCANFPIVLIQHRASVLLCGPVLSAKIFWFCSAWNSASLLSSSVTARSRDGYCTSVASACFWTQDQLALLEWKTDPLKSPHWAVCTYPINGFINGGSVSWTQVSEVVLFRVSVIHCTFETPLPRQVRRGQNHGAILRKCGTCQSGQDRYPETLACSL